MSLKRWAAKAASIQVWRDAIDSALALPKHSLTLVIKWQATSTGHRRRALAQAGRRLCVALAVVATVVGGMPVSAATLYWDQDGVARNDVLTGLGLGGTGTWRTTGAQWWDGVDRVTLEEWNNANNDTAVFTGTAGTVTLGTGITVGGLQFNTTGYTIAGNTLTFGAASNITLNNIAAATINSTLAGSANVAVNGGVFNGLTAGTLTLGGTGTAYTGAVTINNGMTVAMSGATATAYLTSPDSRSTAVRSV